MSQGVQTVLYPVKDLAQAKNLFRLLLGEEPIADAPYYVGFRVAGQDIGLVPNGDAQGLTGPTSYFLVDDIRGKIAALTAAGASEQQAVRDVGGGKLVGTVKDTDGNVIGLMQNP